MLDTIVRIYLELGTTAVQQGRSDLAATFFDSAVKEVKGKTDQDALLASILVEIGQAYANQRQHKKADSYLRWALIIYLNLVGPNSAHVRSVMDQLAENAMAQGMKQKAAQLLKRASLYERKTSGRTNALTIERTQRTSVEYTPRRTVWDSYFSLEGGRVHSRNLNQPSDNGVGNA